MLDWQCSRIWDWTIFRFYFKKIFAARKSLEGITLILLLWIWSPSVDLGWLWLRVTNWTTHCHSNYMTQTLKPFFDNIMFSLKMADYPIPHTPCSTFCCPPGMTWDTFLMHSARGTQGLYRNMILTTYSHSDSFMVLGCVLGWLTQCLGPWLLHSGIVGLWEISHELDQ